MSISSQSGSHQEKCFSSPSANFRLISLTKYSSLATTSMKEIYRLELEPSRTPEALTLTISQQIRIGNKHRNWMAGLLRLWTQPILSYKSVKEPRSGPREATVFPKLEPSPWFQILPFPLLWRTQESTPLSSASKWTPPLNRLRFLNSIQDKLNCVSLLQRQV